jgi:hypothetical protein
MRTIVKERYNVTNSVTEELIEYQYGIKFVDGEDNFVVNLSPNDVDRGNEVFLVAIQDYVNAHNKEWMTVEEFDAMVAADWTDIVVNRDPHPHGGREQPDYVD